MSGVVLRCPNCGTTRALPGECDACHEAEVRFFCTNHKPGHWLESAQCPECGARFGEHAKSPTPEPTPVAPRPPRPSRRPQQPAELSRPRSTLDSSDVVGSPPTDASTDAAEDLRRKLALRNVIMARLPELLGPTRRRPPEDPDLVYSSRSLRPTLGGFVAKALFLAFFFMIALFLFALFLGSSLLGGFGVVIL